MPHFCDRNGRSLAKGRAAKQHRPDFTRVSAELQKSIFGGIPFLLEDRILPAAAERDPEALEGYAGVSKAFQSAVVHMSNSAAGPILRVEEMRALKEEGDDEEEGGSVAAAWVREVCGVGSAEDGGHEDGGAHDEHDDSAEDMVRVVMQPAAFQRACGSGGRRFVIFGPWSERTNGSSTPILLVSYAEALPSGLVLNAP